jgi:hypothetical protein
MRIIKTHKGDFIKRNPTSCPSDSYISPQYVSLPPPSQITLCTSVSRVTDITKMEDQYQKQQRVLNYNYLFKA